MASFGDLRFAHTEGKCSLAVTSENKIMTAGPDGEVRVYTGINDDDNDSYLVGDEVYALACGKQKFFVGISGTNNVQSFSHAGQSEGVITRFTADVTALDLSLDGKLLVAGSEDMTVKIVDTESYKDTHLKGHEAPILSVTIDTKTEPEFVVSTSCDGSLVVWRITDGQRVHEMKDIFPKSNDTALSLTRAATSWDSTSRKLACPLKDSVKLFARETWEELSELKPSLSLGKDEHFSVTAWFPSSNQLAAGTNKGKVVIWDSVSYKIIAEAADENDYPIGNLVWKSEKEIVFINDNGYWGIISVDSKDKKMEPKKKTSMPEIEKAHQDENDDLAAALFDDDDDDNENSFSIRQIKRDTGFASDEDSNLTRPDSAFSAKPDKSPSKMMPAPNAAPAPQPPPVFDIEIQEPFQPCSTPVTLSSRFMVWNSVGIVRAINTEDENAIEVEFHSTDVYHPLHLSNKYNHTMADLNKEGLVLACEYDAEENIPSRLFCHQFCSSNDKAKEWSLEMPSKEEILSLCCGQGWIAVATDRRRLRFFSQSGIQLDILSLPGPVVAMSGHGPFLMVVVHSGMPLMDNQSLIYALYNLKTKKHPSPHYQPLPLAPNSTLSWLGFSDLGSPCIQDSAGQVRMANREYSAWTEICDTKTLVKGVSDNHFVVGVNEEELNIRSILCKGTRYPATIPKPNVVLLPFKLPVCDVLSEKSSLEEELLKTKMKIKVTEESSDLEKAQNETLIKLFALACRGEQESRAYDVCKLMDTGTIQVAIKYASKMKKMQLANRLSELACEIQDREEEDLLNQQAHFEDESQDMFESQSQIGDSQGDEDNPILMAMAKKGVNEPCPKPLYPTHDSRNPFKKNSSSPASNSTIRAGLVFDEMKNTSTSKSRSNQFGSRQFNNQPRNSPTVTLKKTDSFFGKENAAKKAEPIKGFQLWLAENREDLKVSFPNLDDSEINSKGLQQWKGLTKEEKEQYKTLRVPKLGCKRKRNDEDESSAKSAKL